MKNKTLKNNASEIPTKSGVYSVVNLKTNFVYIGSAVNLRRRFYEHSSRLRNGKHEIPNLQKDWNELGKNYFEFKVIELCDDCVLKERESFYLKQNLDKKYNIRDEVTNKGFKHTEQAKELIRQKRSQQVLSPESIKKSVETRKKNNPNVFSDMAKLLWQKIKNGEMPDIVRNYETSQTDEFRRKISKITRERAIKNGRPFKCNETNEIFYTTGDCARKMNLKSYKTIWACLNGLKKSYRGFTFNYLIGPELELELSSSNRL